MELAEVNSKNNLDPDSIISILTLRYDYTQKSILKKLTWQDFVTTLTVPSIIDIEQKISSNLVSSLEDSKSVSIALSGGIDSTLILAMIRKTFPNITINAYSVKFSESVDESKTAKNIADKFEANHKTIHIENYLQELPNAIRTVGSPFWDLHWYYVASEAKKSSQFLASGDGGDEVFGGYTFRYKKYLELYSDRLSVTDKIKNYLKCHERDHVSDQNELFGNAIFFSWEKIYHQLTPYFDNKLEPLQQVFLADYNGKLLYNFSLINSKISSKFDIKSVIPLLSDDLIKYGCQLSSTEKYDDSKNLGKLPLRNLLHNIVPDLKIESSKKGFSVNTSNFWKSHGQKLCKEFLLDSEISKHEYINSDWILKYIHHDEIPIPIINKFLGLLAFEVWYRIFIVNDFNYSRL